MRTNLYKSFVTQGWSIARREAVIGFLHPDGIYDDPRGGPLRARAYPRLRSHFQLINELRLFGEVHNLTQYSVNIYRNEASSGGSFDHISNLFHPSTIDSCYAHDGVGSVPGIKNPDDDFNWDLRGHRSRIVCVDRDALVLFAKLYDEPNTPSEQARLPVVHSTEVMSVLRRFAAQKRRLADLDYFSTQHWNETIAKEDGTIRRETRFPRDAHEWILSGPHFYVATPFNKIPNEGCKNNRDYSDIDLTAIPDDFLPRTNYVPACAPEEYRRRTPKWHDRPVTEFYRHVHREMVGPTAERTLISSIVPPRVGHVHTVFAVALSPRALAELEAVCASLLADFFMKMTGKGHISETLISLTPLPDSLCRGAQVARSLRLNCLSSAYAELWNEIWPDVRSIDGFTVSDVRLEAWPSGTTKWSRESPLRTDLSRRQALIELDALAALSFGLTIDELLTIYRVGFPVLQKYEHENRYDQSGRLVPGEAMKIAEEQGIDTREPGRGIRWTDPKMYPLMEREYVPPFTRHDRAEDMASAYREFEKRLSGKSAA